MADFLKLLTDHPAAWIILPYKEYPRVVASLQKVDLAGDDSEAHINRVLVRVENIRLASFDLCFETWEDSVVYDVAVGWIAAGK